VGALQVTPDNTVAVELLQCIRDRIGVLELVEIQTMRFGMTAKTCMEVVRDMKRLEAMLVDPPEKVVPIKKTETIVALPANWSPQRRARIIRAIEAVVAAADDGAKERVA